VSSECTLVSKTCCEICGKPSLGAIDAVNQKYAAAHHQSVCPTEVSCAPCQEKQSPDLHVTCRAGACTPVDVRKEPATACTSDRDCRLRVTSCCECGGSTAREDLIAIADESAYADVVCDPQQACPACAPVYPTDVEARCASDGHCEVRDVKTPCSLPK
jgi:hypothetical protein